MEKLSFNILQFIEESESIGERYIYPTQETFENLDDQFSIVFDGVYYEVCVEKSDDFIWFSFDYGKPNPRDEKLTNIINGNKRDNDRDLTEAELIQQFFCLYRYSDELMYMSNVKKQNILKAILKEKLNQKFSFKTIKKTKEEFISILTKINKITFTEARNLFSYNSKKRQALVDLTGTDAPEEFSIEASYEESSKMFNFINELFIEKEQNDSVKDLIICGSDENNFEIIFNNDTFNKKIDVKNKRDENGKYISAEVKENLLKEIENEG